MTTKQPIAPPRSMPSGFGWADHRMLRDGFLRLCTPEALSLYLLLVLASDRNGVSFYGDRLVRHLLGLSAEQLESARDNLLRNGLLAWERPIYQLLDIPSAGREGAR